MPYFEYSKDGKTVKVDGKTMSVSAFRRQYDTEEFKGLTPNRKKGSAPKKANAPKVARVDSNPSKNKKFGGSTRIGGLSGMGGRGGAGAGGLMGSKIR